MSPRPNVTVKRTNQIIEAAMMVFARLGFNKARMDDVAEEAGLSKGALYLYFKSKDALIRAILENFLARELAHAREVVDSDHSAAEKLDLFTEIMLSDFKKMQPLMSIYFEFMALAMRRKAVKEVIREFFQDFMGILEPIIEQGIEAGEFHPVNVQEAALAVGALFEGTILLWVYNSELVDLEKHVKSSVRLLLEGLKA
ncbi:MAG: TetR/AcrR family transcriptional regulator [Anaerolineales bacterium]